MAAKHGPLKPLTGGRKPGQRGAYPVKPADVVDGDDRVYDADATEFMMAMQREKERLRVDELTCAQVFTVAKRLGYRKVAPTAELPRFRRGVLGCRIVTCGGN